MHHCIARHCGRGAPNAQGGPPPGWWWQLQEVPRIPSRPTTHHGNDAPRQRHRRSALACWQDRPRETPLDERGEERERERERERQ
ncbi:unnamed protein product, partial [Prorocentrum cordatum]